MNEPLRIGIVTPAHNAAVWVGDAVASVLGQSHRCWTMVVVDDGSTDATAEIVAGVADPRLRLIRQEKIGVSAARNRGLLELAAAGAGHHDAVLFLDADDWLAEDALARLGQQLAAVPGAVAACGRSALVDADAGPGRPLSAHREMLRGYGGDVLERLLVQNLFANGGQLLIRADAIRAAGQFRPALAYGEDWEYVIRIALQGEFAVLRDRSPVLFVRRRLGGTYMRMATAPASFRPCMDAIFNNPALITRFGPAHIAALRARTEAENLWVSGRALLRQGRRAEGRACLRRAVLAKPSVKRSVIALAAHLA